MDKYASKHQMKPWMYRNMIPNIHREIQPSSSEGGFEYAISPLGLEGKEFIMNFTLFACQ